MKQNIGLSRWSCLLVVGFAGGWLASATARGPAASGARMGVREGTNGLTLEAAIRVGLESSPVLEASSARAAAAAGRAFQARKWTNPQLQLSAEEWPVSGGRGFSDAIQTIGIVQTLPYPGKKSLDRRIGGAGVRVSEAELALRRTEVVRDVKAAFARVLAMERLVVVAGELVTVAESSASAARKRVEAGDAAYQEQLRAEVQLVQAQAELRDFQRDLATAREALVTILGRTDLREAEVSGALAEQPRAELLAEKAEAFLGQHPSVLAAQASAQRAEFEYRRARLDPYPDVTMGVSGGKIGETDQSIIQLGFSLPLPILDTSRGRKEEARANLRVAEAELRGVQQALEREWVTAQARYRTAAEQVASYRAQALPKANEALRLVRTGFEQGKLNFIDLVDTQRTTAEVRRAYQEKLLELNVAQAEVEALAEPSPTAGRAMESK